MKLTKSAKQNAQTLLSASAGSDVMAHYFQTSGRTAAVVFLDGVADKALIGEQILQPLTCICASSSIPSVSPVSNSALAQFSDSVSKKGKRAQKTAPSLAQKGALTAAPPVAQNTDVSVRTNVSTQKAVPDSSFFSQIKREEDVLSALFACEVKVQKSAEDALSSLLAGDPALFVEGFAVCFTVGVKKPPARAITEPPTSVVVKGPREGFIEEIKTNLALIRKRLPSEQLSVRMLSAGKYSKSKIAVVHIKGVASEQTVAEICKKIEEIAIDALPDSSYLSQILTSSSPVKQVGQTEKPDVLCAKLCEGRVAVLLDGSPIALTLPYLLLEDFQSAEDYYAGALRATFSRLIRLLAVSVSVLLPGAYVAAQLFHVQTLPLKLFLSIAGATKGIPLSPSLEMLLVLLIFEMLTEASVRMPKYVGLALSVVGALVLGDTAVRAGLISTPAILIMAISGICLYTVPDLVNEFSLLRAAFLLTAGIFGGFGMIVLCAGLFLYGATVENYGTPLFAPFAPRISSDLKDGMLKASLKEQVERPRSLHTKNRTRMRLETAKKGETTAYKKVKRPSQKAQKHQKKEDV